MLSFLLGLYLGWYLETWRERLAVLVAKVRQWL